jgi:eukaryotic-like serine/threonine-protein kinase
MTSQATCIYEFGHFRIDAVKRLLMRNDQLVPLTPKCFEILLALVERAGEVVTKEDLINLVWPDSFVEEGNLTYNISMLRKALGERAGEHQYIVTVPGRGYKFVETVTELMNERPGAEAPELIRTTLAVRANETATEQAAVLIVGAARARSLDESFITRVVRHKRRLMIGAGVLLIAVAGVGFGLYKLISGNRSRTNLAEPFQKMKITRLTTTGKATVAAISPDGKYVAHAMGSRGQQSLWLRHIATGSDTEIVPAAPVDYTSVTYSPDGNYIYFLRDESVDGSNPLYRVPVLGGSIQKLASDVDAGITFSPYGRQIAYVRGIPDSDEAQLITANADGSDEQALLTKHPQWDVFPPPKPWTAWGPAWSPDGGMIAFALRKDEPDGKYWNVMTVRVKDQAEQQITFQKWSSLGQIAWLSDGSGLIVAAAAEGSSPGHQIWHVSYPGGEVRRITNDTSGYLGVRLTADSTAIVTVRNEQNSNIWIAPDGDASHAAQITTSNSDGITGISCTDDGRVVYTTTARGSPDISIVNSDGTGQRQLTVDVRDKFNPSVSPDGRYVVFASNRTGNRCLWRVDIDGSNPKQLTYDTDGRGPSISPDGKWVVYWDVGSGTKTLWKVSIDGGNPVQLTDYFSLVPAVSPDGNQIVFTFVEGLATSRHWKIGVMPFEGGPPTKVFDLPQPSGQIVRWTSDGRALTYLDTRNGVYNIWAQPLDGSPPKQLTNFTTDQIFAYAWSREGKRLACARGSQNSDVVLINALQ